MTVGNYGKITEEFTPPLEARGYKDPPLVSFQEITPERTRYVVRRLTPLECCRLQGYPDGWTEDLETAEPTEQEIDWWTDVFVTWYQTQREIHAAFTEQNHQVAEISGNGQRPVQSLWE